MAFDDRQIDAGQAVYTRRTLSVYDFVVLSISNRLIWQCPTKKILEHYRKNVSANHLDVGVGTGFFLDRCEFPDSQPRIVLMDLNKNSLDFASRRIARYRPETILQNVLEPISLAREKFDSVGINYLLHCLPGSIEAKSIVLDHLKCCMNRGAKLFGSTILQDGVPRSWLANRLMRTYNRRGIFSNQQDSLDGLIQALQQRFCEVSVNVEGCVAIFSGRV